MVSEFAGHAAKRFADRTVEIVGAVGILEVGVAANTLDTELAEVREVLDGLADDGCYGWCWQRWGRERGDDEYHSDACQRARALYQKLRIDK